MFSKISLNRIWNCVNYYNSGIVKDGKTLNYSFQEVDIPAIEEIAETAVTNLKKAGFSIRRVAPKKANCIIRVYRIKKIKDDDNNDVWLYGAEAYLKTIGRMLSEDDRIIDYQKQIIRWWICQDESISLKPHFVDYFIKIS